MQKKKPRHYVNNRDLYEVMKKFHSDYQHAKQHGQPLPPVPEYVGRCILAIADRYARKPSFVRYPFIEEMMMDGVENVLKYIHRFDPNKSENPFAYFTQTIYNAFLRRIDMEKSLMYGRMKMLADSYYSQPKSGRARANMDTVNSIITDFEHKLSERKKKKKLVNEQTAVSKFFGESNQ